MTVSVERRGAVTLLTLDRPEALNALNAATLEELIAAFGAFEADDSQRCAVLTGAGDKAFAAGADIKEMADKPLADFYREDAFARWQSHLVEAVRKPWIAAVNGFALGGGDGQVPVRKRAAPPRAGPPPPPVDCAPCPTNS